MTSLTNLTNLTNANIPEEAFVRLESVYASLAKEVDTHKPPCQASGRCCDFNKSEHRLYASTLEVAYVRRVDPEVVQSDRVLCPFFKQNLCHARSARPLGCRLYFCAPEWQEIMESISDGLHKEVRALHDTYNIPYQYREFVVAMRDEPSQND